MPKTLVVWTELPSFLLVTLEEETEEVEEASSAMEVLLLKSGTMESPKSQSFVYPSASIKMFSGFRLNSKNTN